LSTIFDKKASAQVGSDNSINGVPQIGGAFVGAPYTLHAWHPTIVIQCGCPAKEPVMLVGVKMIGVCKSCKRAYQVKSIGWDAVSNATKLELNIGIVPEKSQLVT
jgi:hypothetical protein